MLWRHADFLRLWAAQSISAYGSRITRTALPIIAVATLHQPDSIVGLLTALQLAPGMVLGLFAGGYVDRGHKRRIMIGADLIRALAVASITLAAVLGALSMVSPSDSSPHAPDTPTSVIRVTGRIATPGRVILACVPVLLILVTPFLPFAVTPTLWFGIPAVLVWMAFTVVLTVVLLNVIDLGIRRQVSAHADTETVEGGGQA